MNDGLNPRFVIWARSIGREPHSLVGAEEIERIDGTPWTAIYMGWVQERWRAWATVLGCDDHRVALSNGHTHDDFDRWLETQS